MSCIYDGRMEGAWYVDEVFYIAGLSSFIGLIIMILTGMTSIGAIWELLKRCPWNKLPQACRQVGNDPLLPNLEN